MLTCPHCEHVHESDIDEIVVWTQVKCPSCSRWSECSARFIATIWKALPNEGTQS